MNTWQKCFLECNESKNGSVHSVSWTDIWNKTKYTKTITIVGTNEIQDDPYQSVGLMSDSKRWLHCSQKCVVRTTIYYLVIWESSYFFKYEWEWCGPWWYNTWTVTTHTCIVMFSGSFQAVFVFSVFVPLLPNLVSMVLCYGDNQNSTKYEGKSNTHHQLLIQPSE